MMTRLAGIVLAYLLPFLALAQGGDEQLRARAEALFNEQRFAEAMPLYSQLVSLSPSDRELNYRFGTSLLFVGEDKEKAVGYLKFATESPAIAPAAWYWLGRAYHLNYRFADALTTYQRYRGVADKKTLEELPVEAFEQQCRNGQKLLSKLKDITVRSKVEVAETEFFRFYDLSDIGGRIVVTPDELKSSLDKKRKLRSLVYLPDKGGPIYFSSYGKDGDTGLDIYRTELLPDGKFATPLKLAGFINTEFDEDYAFMHPDGKTFYFSSKGHSSMGGYDVFRTSYDLGMDAFGRPENMDFAVNTPDDDIFYMVDAEQKEACFASGRSSKQGQLHVYRVATTQTPLIITILRGTFASEFDANDRKARIVVEDAVTREQVADVRTDINGSYVLALPRSGKFRFMVECGPTGKTHSGTVDVPRSEAPKAYRQELTLTKQGDLERLMIRNYFDEPLDGDIIALALEEIKRRARLDVTGEKVPAPEQPIAEVPKDVLTQAGFAGNVDHNEVIRSAQEDFEQLDGEVKELEGVSAAAYGMALEAVTEAEKATKEAETLLAKAAAQSNENERNATMVQAAMQRQRARDAELRAQAAYRTGLAAEDERLTKRQQAAVAEKLSTDLSRTVTAEGNAASLPYLTALKERLDTKSGPMGRMDLAEVTRRAVGEKEQEVSRMMQQANAKRTEESELVDRMNRLRREQEDARTKSKKDELAQEIATYQEQLGYLNKETEAAFAKARVLERETAVQRGTAGLTKHLLDNGSTSGTTLERGQAEALQQRISVSRSRADALAIDERFDAMLPIRANDRESRSFAWDRSAASAWAETERTTTIALERSAEQDAERMSSRNANIEGGAARSSDPLSAQVASENDGQSGKEGPTVDQVAATQGSTPNGRTSAPLVSATDPSGTGQDRQTEPLAAAQDNATQQPSGAGNASQVAQDGATPTSTSTNTSNGQNAAASETAADQRKAGSNSNDAASPLGTGNDTAGAAERGTADNASQDPKSGSDNESDLGEVNGSDAGQANGDAPNGNDPIANSSALAQSPEQVRNGSGVKAGGTATQPAAAVDSQTQAFLLENRLAELRQMASAERERSVRDSLQTVIQQLEAAQREQERSTALAEEMAAQEPSAGAEQDGFIASMSAEEARRMPLSFDTKEKDEELINALFAEHSLDEQRLLTLADADERAAGLHGLELMLADSIRAEMARQVALLELDPQQAATVLPRVDRLRELRAARLALAEQYLRDREQELLAATTDAPSERGATEERVERTGSAAGQDPINDRFIVIDGDTRNIYASPVAHRSPEVAEALVLKEGELARLEELQQGIDSLQYKADRMDFGRDRDKVLKSMDRLKDDQLITRTDLGQRSAFLTKQEWSTATDSLSALEKDLVRKGAPPTEPLLVMQRTMKSDAQELKKRAEAMRKTADRTEDILVRDTLYRQAYELELRSLREVDRSITVANYLLSEEHTRGETLAYSDVASRVLSIPEEELLANGSPAASTVRRGTVGEQDPTSTRTAAGSAERSAPIDRTVQNSGITQSAALPTEEIAEPSMAAGSSATNSTGIAAEDPATRSTLALEQGPTGTASPATNAAIPATLEPVLEPSVEIVVDRASEPAVEPAAATQANADLARARANAEAIALREVSALDATAERSTREYEELLTNGSSAASGNSLILKDDGSVKALELAQAADRTRQQQQEALALGDRAMQLEDSAANVMKKRDREALEQMALRMRVQSDSLQGMALLGAQELREAERAYLAEQQGQALRRRLVKFYYLSGDEQDMVMDNSDQSRYFAARTAALAQYDAAAEAAEAARVNRELGQALKLLTAQVPPRETPVQIAERQAGNEVLLARGDALLQRADSLDDMSRRLKGAAAINESQAAVMLQGASEEDATAMMALEMRTRRTEPLLAVARDQAGSGASSATTTPEATAPGATTSAPSANASTSEATAPSATTSAPTATASRSEATAPVATTSAPTVAASIEDSRVSRASADATYLGALVPKVLVQDIFELRPSTTVRSVPIAMDAPMPEGIVFKVQIGAFRNAIPEETFGDMTPVMGESVGNGLVRYTAGLFTTFDQAAGAKDEVRDRGYRDAFVVSYRNGVRITLTEAMRASQGQQPLAVVTPPVQSTATQGTATQGTATQGTATQGTAAQGTRGEGDSRVSGSEQPSGRTEPSSTVTSNSADRGTETERSATAPVTAVIERPSVVPVSSTPEEEVATILAKYPASAAEIVERFVPADRVADYYNVPGAAPARQVETIKGLFFTVQVGVYSKPVALDKLFNISPLNSELTESGKIRYTTGMFLDSEVARVRKDGTVQLGVKDAFVTSYLNGKRIPMREAAALLERFGPEILAKP